MILNIVLMHLFLRFPVSAKEEEPQIVGEAAVVADVKTGEILYEKNAAVTYYPASITKCMTALVVLEQRDLNDTIEFSKEALFSIESGSSAAYMKPGEIMTVKDSLYVMMLHSANDVAHGLAYDIGGDLPGFAKMMNEKAEELGCTDTNFVNASGLQDENHYTTASDMMKIAQAAYKNKMLRKIMGTVQYQQDATNLTKDPRTWINGNRMIRKESEYYYEPCLGGKTGYTMTAGGTLVTYAKIQNKVLACVVLKSKNSASAYEDSMKLYDYVNENVPLSENQRSRAKQISDDGNNEKAEKEDTKISERLWINLKEHWIFLILGMLVLIYLKKRIALARRRRARERQRARARAKERERRKRR